MSRPPTAPRRKSSHALYLIALGVVFNVFVSWHININLLHHQESSAASGTDANLLIPGESSPAVKARNISSRKGSTIANERLENYGGNSTNFISKINNTSHQNKQGLSACLLVNDENPRLPEWLAYHYHILPLRSLIITVDPASRTSPVDILNRWTRETDLEVAIWQEDKFLPREDGSGVLDRGPCFPGEHADKTDCLWHYLKRQRYFIKKCMAEFKRQNKTWVLLTDVDEYITFNNIEDDDPNIPMEYAPPGVPTLSKWKRKDHEVISENGRVFTQVYVEGIISGLSKELKEVHRNGDKIKTKLLASENDYDVLLGKHGVQPGNVVIENGTGTKYYLQDDFLFRQAEQMPESPGSVATIKNATVDNERGILRGTIFNDWSRKHKDGEFVEIRTNWREPPVEIKTFMGGHLMSGLDKSTYYVQREHMLWPPQMSSKDSMDIRHRLPTVGDGKTILEVIESEMNTLGDYAVDTIGPCLAMPRLLFGPYENKTDAGWKDMAPQGFADNDFVTLRYRWHAMKEAKTNRYQKTIVDVSRLREDSFSGEAENIHVPINRYHCRSAELGGPPRYSTSIFRVNHYIDSFEAYSYRNDARGNKTLRMESYEKKRQGTAAATSDSIRSWLNSFVQSVGFDKAKKLLDGAGHFVRLS